MSEIVPISREEPKVDGRVLRAARTRQLVAETFLDLLTEGVAHPTAKQVSDRSGVSMSSIFRLFDDVDAMHSAAIAIQLERVAPIIVDPDPSGPVERRVRSLVETRAKLLEAITPVRRMGVRLAVTSEPIRFDLAVANEFFRTQLEQLFAPELSALPPATRLDRLDKLDAVTSWDMWERLRNAQGVPEKRACRLVTAMVLAVFRGD